MPNTTEYAILACAVGTAAVVLAAGVLVAMYISVVVGIFVALSVLPLGLLFIDPRRIPAWWPTPWALGAIAATLLSLALIGVFGWPGVLLVAAVLIVAAVVYTGLRVRAMWTRADSGTDPEVKPGHVV